MRVGKRQKAYVKKKVVDHDNGTNRHWANFQLDRCNLRIIIISVDIKIKTILIASLFFLHLQIFSPQKQHLIFIRASSKLIFDLFYKHLIWRSVRLKNLHHMHVSSLKKIVEGRQCANPRDLTLNIEWVVARSILSRKF